MPKLTPTRSQRQTQKYKKILSQNYIQLQNLIISTTHEITQTFREELAPQNPALELYEEPFIYPKTSNEMMTKLRNGIRTLTSHTMNMRLESP